MIFDSLQDGLHYYTDCPLCAEPMKIENLGFKQVLYNRGNKLGYTLLFSLDYDDKLIVNPITEEVIIDLVGDDANTEDRPQSPVNYTKAKFNTNSMINYNGTMMHPVLVSCSKCGCFSYSLKLTVDLNNRRLIETSLSVMRLLIKDNGKIYEITNFFGRQYTTYCLLEEKGSKEVTLPFIEMNLLNPQETLDRIRKLLIFS